MTCKDANWMQEKWGIMWDILNLHFHTKDFFAQDAFKMSLTPTKLRLLFFLFPTVNFLWGLRFCVPWEYSHHIYKSRRGAREEERTDRNLGWRLRSERGSKGAAAPEGNRRAEAAASWRACRGSGAVVSWALARSATPASPLDPNHPEQGSHCAGGWWLQHFPSSLSWLTSTSFAECTYSPMTGSMQTRICTLQSLMKFVLTPKSKVMRRKLVHSLTRQFQTAVLKLQKDIFLLSPDFN